MARNNMDDLTTKQTNRKDAASGARRAEVNRATARHEREIARRAARDQQIVEPVDDYTPPLFSLSGIRNNLIHSNASKFVMLLLIFIFAVGFLLLGNNQPANLPVNGRANPNGASAPEVVATAAGQPISRADFENAAQQQAQMASYYGQSVNPTNYFMMQQSALQQLTGRAALLKAAQDANVTASDDEINARIEKEITNQIAQQSGGNPAAARRLIEQQYGSEDKYREELRAKFDRDKVSQALVIEKYQKQWQDAHKSSEADYLKSLTKLDLNVILTRPKMPAQGDKNPGATYQKNQADAKVRLDKIAAQLKGLQGAALQAKFMALAKTGSDDEATKAKGGALGLKAPADLPAGQETKDALNAISSTPSLVGPLEDKGAGSFALYLATAKKVDFPKDYAKNKDKLLKAFQDQSASSAWEKYAQDLGKSADVQISDPALDAFKTQSGPMAAAGTDDPRAAVLEKYDDALSFSGGEEAAAIHYQKAQIYTGLKQADKYLSEMRAAIAASQNTVPIRLELARALVENKDSKGAIEQLQAASKQLDNAPATQSLFGGNPNDALRAQIASELETAGRLDLATAERKKLTPAPGKANLPGQRANNVITIPQNALPQAAKP